MDHGRLPAVVEQDVCTHYPGSIEQDVAFDVADDRFAATCHRQRPEPNTSGMLADRSAVDVAAFDFGDAVADGAADQRSDGGSILVAAAQESD